jgi:hypothetical protein
MLYEILIDEYIMNSHDLKSMFESNVISTFICKNCGSIFLSYFEKNKYYLSSLQNNKIYDEDELEVLEFMTCNEILIMGIL